MTTFVEVVNNVISPADLLLEGVDGTVNIPAGGRVAYLAVVADPDVSATIDFGSQPTITVPKQRNFGDTFRYTEEGPFDITFTNTLAYHVRYFVSDFVPAEVVIV